MRSASTGFIPLNGALCLQHRRIARRAPCKFHSPKRGVMPATESRRRLRNGQSFIPLNGALCLQLKQDGWALAYVRFIPLNGALCLQRLWFGGGSAQQVSFP